MIPSRRLWVMFVCVFALGAVAGGLIVYNFSGTRFSDFLNRTGDPAALAARIDNKYAVKYHLDAEEQARISPLTREMAENLFQVRRKFAEDVLATIDASHAKIAAQMTAEQRSAYVADMAEKRRTSAAMLAPTTNSALPAR